MSKQIKQIVISIIMVSLLMIGAYFTVTVKSFDEKSPIEDFVSDSDIVSSDPKTTAVKFIEANGTIGDVEKDITQESMVSSEATYLNGTRRLNSLIKIEEAVIPGNKLIMGNERNNIKNYVNNLDYPFIYKVTNMLTSEPSKPTNLTVYADSGNVDYESVKVLVDFDSTRIHYTRPKDVTYAGVHSQISNTESYKDIEVVLVKSGNLWFVYDITDSEQLINERFSSWSGFGLSTIDYEKDNKTGEFIIDDFEQYYFDETDN